MNLDNRAMVDAIYGIGILLFGVFLFVGASVTIARMAYYRAHRFKRPRLLVRDAVVISSFALTMGLIMVARVLGATNLRDNVLWALATTVPLVIAFGTYAFYEVAVIERPHEGSTSREDPYLSPRGPDVPHQADDE